MQLTRDNASRGSNFPWLRPNRHHTWNNRIFRLPKQKRSRQMCYTLNIRRDRKDETKHNLIPSIAIFIFFFPALSNVCENLTHEFSVRRVARIHRRPTRDRRRHDLPVGILEQIDDVAPVRGHAIARFALGAIITMHILRRKEREVGRREVSLNNFTTTSIYESLDPRHKSEGVTHGFSGHSR